MDPVEAVEQPELVGVPLVAALHTVPVSVTGKLPAQNLLQHATAEICAGRAAEEGGEVRLKMSCQRKFAKLFTVFWTFHCCKYILALSAFRV